MRALPLLHIGYPKTGSSWFQQVFYPQVRDLDFYTPQRLRQHESSPLRASKNRLVVCDETLLGQTGHLIEQALQLREIFGPSEIVLFIRNPMDKLPSNYSEYLKAGGTLSLRDFVLKEHRPRYAEKHCYDLVIRLYRDLFGMERVHVYLFEDFQSDPKPFLEKFCYDLDLRPDWSQLNYQPVNQRLTVKALNRKRRLNQLAHAFPLLVKGYLRYKKSRVANAHSSNPTEAPGHRSRPSPFPWERYFTPVELQELRATWYESNQNLIDHYDLSSIITYQYPLASDTRFLK